MPRKQAAKPPSSIETLLDQQLSALETDLAALDKLSQRAIKATSSAKKYDKGLASHVAWLAGKRAEIVSHLRQLDKHNRVMSNDPERRFAIVKEYIRGLDLVKRGEILEFVTQLEQGRSVLS